jgi:hypothetical protein
VTATNTRCRVRIVNHIDGHTAVVESPRDRSLVLFDLARLIRTVNRRRDETVKGALCFTPEMITLHWHCPWCLRDDLAKAILEVSEPLHQAEKLLWKGAQPV